MSFESNLIGNILDPIHGAIRITELERTVISHALFQRLRNVKQNTFLYKVFPSAMHSRFEHSLGVMHAAYEMFSSLILNSHRYKSKYKGDLLYSELSYLPSERIQELRLAALLHDVGHGPMSHQFDDFMMSEEDIREWLGNDFEGVFNLIHENGKVEHEHISLIFIKKIFDDIKDDVVSKINVDNVLKIIENKYLGGEIIYNGDNVQPLLSSLISSCPIDADRMDYMLRDSYFSGVKCGIYNVKRLLMSMVPIIENNKVYLGFKESSLDSISEFIFSRSNLFSQVYFHKTNRSFSSMLSKACELVKERIDKNIFVSGGVQDVESLQDFYVRNTDEYFVNNTLACLAKNDAKSANMVACLKNRKPWKKLYEFKFYKTGKVKCSTDKEKIDRIRAAMTGLLDQTEAEDKYLIDIVSDNAFKDVGKSESRLLIKNLSGDYVGRPIIECGDKLDVYQSIRYFVRVFISRDCDIENETGMKKSLDSVCRYHLS